MSHAVVLSGALLAFLSRGCSILGEGRRWLGQLGFRLQCSSGRHLLHWTGGTEPGRGQMGSYDVTREQPALPGEIPGVKRLRLEPWGNSSWMSVVRASHLMLSSGRRWPTVCPISFKEKRADKLRWGGTVRSHLLAWLIWDHADESGWVTSPWMCLMDVTARSWHWGVTWVPLPSLHPQLSHKVMS